MGRWGVSSECRYSSCSIWTSVDQYLCLHVASLGQNELMAEITWYSCDGIVNSLAPGRFQFNFRKVIFKLNLVNGGWGISYEIALRWMPQDLADDKSTLVQVMAWCRQATSHYLSQCWPRFMLSYGVTRPQWVKCHRCIVLLFFDDIQWVDLIKIQIDVHILNSSLIQ